MFLNILLIIIIIIVIIILIIYFIVKILCYAPSVYTLYCRRRNTDNDCIKLLHY